MAGVGSLAISIDVDFGQVDANLARDILDIRRAELSGKEFSTRLEITGRDQEADFIGRGTQASLAN